MAQRVDVLVTVRSGAWPIVAKVEGRDGYASTVLRSHDAVPMSNPDVGCDISELNGRLVTESELRPAESVLLEKRDVDRDYRVELIQAGDRYVWGMAGPDAGRLVMKEGERIRITMVNSSPMWHPMHTHGHTFAVPGYGVCDATPSTCFRGPNSPSSSTRTIRASGCSTVTTPITSRQE